MTSIFSVQEIIPPEHVRINDYLSFSAIKNNTITDSVRWSYLVTLFPSLSGQIR
jgi:hypothetical protein